MGIGLGGRRTIFWYGAAEITEPRRGDQAVAIFDVILAYEETLIIATAGTVRE